MSTTQESYLPELRARHEMCNALVRYLRAVDDHDVEGVVRELRHAVVSFGGHPHCGVDELTQTYRDAFAHGGRTRHLLHEIEIAREDPLEPDDLSEVTSSTAAVNGRAAYQRWSMDTDPPTVTALGHYQVSFADVGDEWRWTSMTVHRDWQATQTPPTHQSR